MHNCRLRCSSLYYGQRKIERLQVIPLSISSSEVICCAIYSLKKNCDKLGIDVLKSLVVLDFFF